MSFGAFVKAVLMSYSLLIITNLVGTLITTAIGNLKGSPIINPVEEITLNMNIPFLLLFTVIGAPIFEELFFRKFLVDRIVQYGELLSVIISGFMFGLLHGNLSQFPYAFTLGAFLAFIYIRTGKIRYTIILHAIINFMGSIVGGLILKNIDLDFFDSILGSVAPEEMLMTLTIQDLFGFLVLIIYEMTIMILVVIGIIFWILEFKKFFFKTGEYDIEKGSRFKTSVCNRGMMVYIIFWLIMIVLASI
jgi:membrane protease YdiL (CAAX protease family)